MSSDAVPWIRHAQARAQIDEWRTEFYGERVPSCMRPSFDPAPFRPPPRRRFWRWMHH